MKTVNFISLALALTALVSSCKSETQETPPPQSSTVSDLAIAKEPTTNPDLKPEQTYKYVVATTGLSLREFNNLNSEKIAIMPYGSQVKVLTPENKNTMTIQGIKGGMDEVAFNHKKGYAFNGYLSRYFPPDEDMSFNGYFQELKAVFPEVTYKKTVGESVRKPTTTETITLPNARWHETFFIAKKLGKIPVYFPFPSVKGKDNQILVEPNSKDKPWVSELRVTRENNQLRTIKYYYKNKNLTTIITIEKTEDGMKISKTEIIS
jgi:hypothetical protein